MALQIAIVGMNKIGASLGLALRHSGQGLHCVGFDGDPHNGKAAERLGAVEKCYHSLPRCVRESDVVILANPLDEVKESLAVIADHAPPGTVVVDTSPVKGKVMRWAAEILPEGVYFTGWVLALNPEHLYDPEVGNDAARKDLFEDSLVGITDLPGTPGEALNLSGDLVTSIGGTPFFISDVEADGLIAMGHELPRLAALALLLATVDSPGWHEAQKLAGEDFAKATLPSLNVPERDALGLSMQLNRENVIRLVDDMIRSLMRLRGHLEDEDAAALQADIEHAIHQRGLWLEARKKMSWDARSSLAQSQIRRPSVLGNWLQNKLDQAKDLS